MKKITKYLSAGVFASGLCALTGVTAHADMPEPVLREKAVFGDRVVISLDNADDYPNSAEFSVSVNGKKARTFKSKSGNISLYDDGERYFKTNTRYKINVSVTDGEETSSADIVTRTQKATYYKMCKGTMLYKRTGGLMTRYKRAQSDGFEGVQVTSSGGATAGKPTQNKRTYVKIKNGIYKGCYVKASQASRVSDVSGKRASVTEYGEAMEGGRYVFGAAAFRRTDCSGLTMQCFAQIGVNLPHNAAAQRSFGKSVSLANARPGDLMILNYGSHAALYLGDGEFVHALNEWQGIKIEPILKLRYYHIDSIRRVIV